MSWDRKISIDPWCNSFYCVLSSPDTGSQMPDNSKSQARVWRAYLKQGIQLPGTKLMSWKVKNTLRFFGYRISDKFQFPRKWHCPQCSRLLAGPVRILELFMRKRPHCLAFVKQSNRSPSQHLCPLATVQTGNTKHLRIVTKWIIPRTDPKDGRVSKVWTNRIKGEAESGRGRSI